MKKLLSVVGLIILVASVAQAQIDPDHNGLGVYFDQQGLIRCQNGVTPGMKSVYLIATNISQPGGIGGWECKVNNSNAMWMFLSATLAGVGPINLFTAPVFQVGLGVPMSPAPIMVLTTIQYFVQDMNPANFTISAIQYPSVPGVPAVYADGADVGNLVPFVSPQANWLLPVASANNPNCNIVGADPQTWGAVKGMFK